MADVCVSLKRAIIMKHKFKRRRIAKKLIAKKKSKRGLLTLTYLTLLNADGMALELSARDVLCRLSTVSGATMCLSALIAWYLVDAWMYRYIDTWIFRDTYTSYIDI